jgi:hypothetical protein
MVKFIISSILVGTIVYLAGLYPHIAVAITAIAIVLIFKLGEWFSE